MKIAVVLPTRGIVFAEVEQQIEKMRLAHDIFVFRSWDKGIPDAQNYLVAQALAIDPDYVLFIEEDTIPTDTALSDMLSEDADIAFVDYGVNGWSCSAKLIDSTLLWCGFGCTLVKRHVFDKLEEPYFRTDKSLRLNDWQWIDNKMKYGGQDIWFCMQAREKGLTLRQAKGECRHMRLTELGSPETNNGAHRIEQKPVIAKWQVIRSPEPADPTVLTIDRSIPDNEGIGKNPTSSF
jgi:hypothetical protein